MRPFLPGVAHAARIPRPALHWRQMGSPPKMEEDAQVWLAGINILQLLHAKHTSEGLATTKRRLQNTKFLAAATLMGIAWSCFPLLNQDQLFRARSSFRVNAPRSIQESAASFHVWPPKMNRSSKACLVLQASWPCFMEELWWRSARHDL